MEEAKQLFLDDLEKIKGFYADGLLAFNFLKQHLDLSRAQTIEMLKRTSPEHANDEYLDTVIQAYAEEMDPAVKVGATTHHKLTGLNVATQGEVKKRNETNGENYYQLGNLAIVIIYHLWDEKHRKLLSGNGPSIEADIFGDLKILRNDIIHNHGVLHKDLALIPFFKKGDRVLFNSQKFAYCVKEISNVIEAIK
ncbi:TPA: hypothetical protein DCR79_00490 [Patescibacteria group bacterium]|nr:hypothetical protein [Patescibacteria group bacterium]